MSAVAGIASKVVSKLPLVGKIAKGAWNIGKKVVGGIKNIFTGGKAKNVAQGVSNMVNQGKQIVQGVGGMVDSGRQIYQGFRQGGLSGGMSAVQQQMPQMQQTMGGMIDAGRGMYQQGRDMYNQGRDMYQQTKGVIQGGMNDMRDMRKRIGGYGGVMPRQLPWMRPGAIRMGGPVIG